MSSPQSKSTQTTASPTAVADRTRRTPDAPFITASIGKVTSASMSVGAMPCPFDEHRHRRRGHVRQHVDGHLAQDDAAPHEERAGAGEHRETVAQRPANERIQHQWVCPCAGTCGDSAASRISGAPTVTTRSPAATSPITST